MVTDIQGCVLTVKGALAADACEQRLPEMSC